MTCLLVDQPTDSANNDNDNNGDNNKNNDNNSTSDNDENNNSDSNSNKDDEDDTSNQRNSQLDNEIRNNNNNSDNDNKDDDDYDNNHIHPLPIVPFNSTVMNDSYTGIIPLNAVGAERSSYLAAVILTFGLTVVTVIGIYRLLLQRARLQGREHYIAI
jgi:hypothetical protein